MCLKRNILRINYRPLNQNLTSRYNRATDMVQLYDGTRWVDWKKANLAWDGYLFKDGVYDQSMFQATDWNSSIDGVLGTRSKSQTLSGGVIEFVSYSSGSATDGSANGSEFISPLKLPELGQGKLVVKYYSSTTANQRATGCFGIKTSTVASGTNAYRRCAYGYGDAWTNVLVSSELIALGSDATQLKTVELPLSATTTENDVYFGLQLGGLGQNGNSNVIRIKSIQFVAN